MNYPTIEQVEAADREQICRWWRFLPGPGMKAIGQSNFQIVLDREVVVMDAIARKFKEFGGFTPEISKMIGWE